MDERLRLLERSYCQEPTPEGLYQLLSWYTKSMPISDADLRILSLIAMESGFKPGGPKRHNSHWLEPDQLKDLYERGYEAGVYFVAKEPHTDSNLVIATLIRHLQAANRNAALNISYASIDMIDTGPGNAYARSRLPSGEDRWAHNLAAIRKATLISNEEWQHIHQLLLSYYRRITRGKQNTPYGRYFIPAWLLEACYAFVVNQYVQGMSRNTRRDRTDSRIDWHSVGKVSDLRSRLYRMLEESPEILGYSPKDFGLNLFLAIDRHTRRTLADRWRGRTA